MSVHPSVLIPSVYIINFLNKCRKGGGGGGSSQNWTSKGGRGEEYFGPCWIRGGVGGGGKGVRKLGKIGGGYMFMTPKLIFIFLSQGFLLPYQFKSIMEESAK